MIRLTPARRAWLIELRNGGPRVRAKTNVAFYCMQAGWSRWVYHDKTTRQPITKEEAKSLYGDRWFECIRFGGREEITPAGVAVLEEKA